ncbi:auxin-induced protein 5NG4-like protein [Corchorus olitorius]|uniref:Auxin-induced protein 5NG4-like protein n=1 Tax=Corchorus olitorius TaxID=93759 RepID=A0A1R3H2Q9_9ROSI|nr:auxin-induced protein 5NG4-like protein [Corchorus olitorius]
MARRYCCNDVLPFTAMVASEIGNVGLQVLFKAATSKGMSYYVFITYTYAMASLVLLPLLFILNCRAVLPPLKFHFISRMLLLGVIGY